MQLYFDAHYSSRDPSKARTITYHVAPPTIQTILFLLTVIACMPIPYDIYIYIYSTMYAHQARIQTDATDASASVKIFT